MNSRGGAPVNSPQKPHLRRRRGKALWIRARPLQGPSEVLAGFARAPCKVRMDSPQGSRTVRARFRQAPRTIRARFAQPSNGYLAALLQDGGATMNSESHAPCMKRMRAATGTRLLAFLGFSITILRAGRRSPMDNEPTIHPYAYKHGLAKGDILHAWSNAYASQARTGPWPSQHVSVGPDRKGRDVQIVSVWNADERTWVIFHAMAATDKVRRELGIAGKRRLR